MYGFKQLITNSLAEAELPDVIIITLFKFKLFGLSINLFIKYSGSLSSQ